MFKCRWLLQLSHDAPILISGCGMSMLLCRLHECIDVHCCALLLVSMDTWCWSTRTPWILAVPGPLACSADGVVYQRSGTVGANAARCAALLAPGVGDGPTKKAVIFWWSSWTSQENGDCIRLVVDTGIILYVWEVQGYLLSNLRPAAWWRRWGRWSDEYVAL